MYLNIKLGCSSCRYSENKTVLMPFNNADEICPKCGELDSMYIVSINDTAKAKELNNINQLFKLRQL